MKPNEKKLLGIILNIVDTAHANKSFGETIATSYENTHIEYTLAPFEGYKGDKLQWFFIRDLTDNKNQLEELSLFHNSIETILAHKISELKESERMRKSLTNELNSLKEHLQEQPSEGNMVGSSRALTELRDMVFQVAKSDATILITGESGTGKELVANLLRESSNRNDKPFLKINCNTISDSLLESDLFGHERGAFTGADSKRKGKFEVVDGGTIFLDEIGDISPRMQAALLRVLQDGEIIRVGGNIPIKIDVRVIAATNRDLTVMVQEGSFRLDLFYRLNIINISIPPLRERKEDIIDLTTHFIRKYRQAFKKDISFLPQSILDKLLMHNWPGNVRELQNVIQRAVLMAKNNAITENELFFDMQPGGHEDNSKKNYLDQIDGKSLKTIIAEIEKDVIEFSLKKNRGKVAETVEQLEIGKTAFYDKMKRYNISPKDHSY
ncbi:sigma-54-dependent Fis family transcriptional regulator [Desulforhopalus sp. IMCC35007]|uniref:sigma-54 interaction domain-containing protein n=1 Tax=Desulforhopalus sp. IMCC35007 TaxID=2569543 RepID=UPI00145FA1A7|nr:sigma-54 dependent transcriptional regulator [Desulforhopalus sp. IMCC35007]